MIQATAQDGPAPDCMFVVELGDGIAVTVEPDGTISPVQLVARIATYAGGWLGPIIDPDAAAAAEAKVAAARATIDLPPERIIELTDDNNARIVEARRARQDLGATFRAQLADELVAATGLGETARPWATQTVDDAYVVTNIVVFGGEYQDA